MRIMTLTAIAVLLGTPLTVDPASAQTKSQARKKAPAPKRKRDPLATERAMREMLQEGGAVGCYGGCDRAEPVAPPKPPRPSPASAWYGNIKAAGVDDAMGRGLTLSVTCSLDGTYPVLAVNPTVLTRGERDKASPAFTQLVNAEYERAFAGMSG